MAESNVLTPLTASLNKPRCYTITGLSNINEASRKVGFQDWRTAAMFGLALLYPIPTKTSIRVIEQIANPDIFR
jgi:hypothetical protein